MTRWSARGAGNFHTKRLVVLPAHRTPLPLRRRGPVNCILLYSCPTLHSVVRLIVCDGPAGVPPRGQGCAYTRTMASLARTPAHTRTMASLAHPAPTLESSDRRPLDPVPTATT